MKKSTVIGLVLGVAVGTAAAITTKKIVKEIKGDLTDKDFVSPDGNNTVTLSFGTSETARGLTYIKVNATSSSKEDSCKLIAFAIRKDDFLHGEWSDNDHFKLLIGCGKRKQCCDVNFEEDQIVAHYYLVKDSQNSELKGDENGVVCRLVKRS